MDHLRSRREFIVRGVCFAQWAKYGKYFPASVLGLGSTTVPRSARAEPITIALAVGSAVAGLIAAHNRSDGGLSAILKSTLSYQRVIADQLQALSKGLENVLRKIDEILPGVNDLLTQHRLKALRTEIGAAALTYIKEMQRASQFASFQEWQNHHLTKEALLHIFKQTIAARNNLESTGARDPITAASLILALNTELAVRAALVETPRGLMAVAQGYLNQFKEIADPSVTGSTQWELQEHRKKYSSILATLRSLGYLVPPSYTPAKKTVPLYQVEVRDFFAGQAKEERCVGRGSIKHGTDTDEPRCVTIRSYIPRREGPASRFVYMADVQEFLLGTGISGAEPFEIRQFSVVSKPEVRNADASCPPCGLLKRLIVNADAPSHDARHAIVGGAEYVDAAAAVHTALVSNIDALNLESANIAMCISSLSAIESAKAAIFNAFRRI